MIIKNRIRYLKMIKFSKYIKKLQRNKSDDCYIKVFKNFNLLDSLKTIAIKSWNIDASTSEAFNINQQEDIDPQLIYINQFVLAYLANILIISGANNHRNLRLSDFTTDEMISFCSAYFNNLKEPLITNNNIEEYFIRLNYEQFDYNICEAYCIARSIELYINIASKVTPILQDYFLQNTNLSIEAYFKIAYIIYIYSHYSPIFQKQNLIKSIIQYFPNISANEVEYFLETNSSSIVNLRQIDADRNQKCHRGSKYKYNFLKEFPIVEIKKDSYIIPNKTIYIKQIFDIFWKFEKYIGLSFRESYFDKIFDAYVGNILKNIFSSNKIEKITYDKNNGEAEFFDWCVFDETNKIIYAFECKGYQLNISNIVTGNISEQYLSKFIDKPISQMFNRLADLTSGQYDKINHLQGYTIIPIGIYYDIPFASGTIHENEINLLLKDDELINKLSKSHKQISRIIKDGEISHLENFDYYLLSVSDLELLQGAIQYDSNLLNFKDILFQMRKDDTLMERFGKLIFDKTSKKNIKVPYLDDIYNKFADNIELKQ